MKKKASTKKNIKIKDWRKSKAAHELRSFIDTVFQPRKGSLYMNGLDREIIIDFVAKQITLWQKK